MEHHYIPYKGRINLDKYQKECGNMVYCPYVLHKTAYKSVAMKEEPLDFWNPDLISTKWIASGKHSRQLATIVWIGGGLQIIWSTSICTNIFLHNYHNQWLAFGKKAHDVAWITDCVCWYNSVSAFLLSLFSWFIWLYVEDTMDITFLFSVATRMHVQ